MNIDTREAMERAITKLDAIDASDPERAHGEADGALIQLLVESGMPLVAEAYVMLMERAEWWASA